MAKKNQNAQETTVATVKKMTPSQLYAKSVEQFARQNGFEDSLFSDKALNKLTKDFYTAQSKGSIALWDMAETLSKVEESIVNGDFVESDGIKSFSGYCKALGLDKSNYFKYVKAFRQYKDLKYAGFSLGIAVALLGTNISASDFCSNYEPTDITVAELKKMLKERNEQKTIEDKQAEEQGEQAEEEEQETDVIDINADDIQDITEETYTFTKDTLRELIEQVATYAKLTNSTAYPVIVDCETVYNLIQSASRH